MGLLPPLVLFTAFEPFAGRPMNGSQEVLALLKAKRQQLEFHLHTCLLPVEYEKGAAAAVEAFRSLPARPQMVLSLGEAREDIQLESRFHNLDDCPALADNAGLIRNKALIEPGASQQRPSTLPLAAMFSAGPFEVKVRPSSSPGHFVCNGTAFRLAGFFADERIPYGFIHVPRADCGPKVMEATTEAIIKMLVSGSKALEIPQLPMPTALAEVEERLKKITTKEDREFYEELRKDYLSLNRGDGIPSGSDSP